MQAQHIHNNRGLLISPAKRGTAFTGYGGRIAGTKIRSTLGRRCVTPHTARHTLDVGSTKGVRRAPDADSCDVVLSSGFLSFANHSGFLQAVEQQGFKVGGVIIKPGV
eukprot:534964-Prorocentrum_minimum.AAC.1